jgi:hypothetical protein
MIVAYRCNRTRPMVAQVAALRHTVVAMASSRALSESHESCTTAASSTLSWSSHSRPSRRSTPWLTAAREGVTVGLRIAPRASVQIGASAAPPPPTRRRQTGPARPGPPEAGSKMAPPRLNIRLGQGGHGPLLSHQKGAILIETPRPRFENGAPRPRRRRRPSRRRRPAPPTPHASVDPDQRERRAADGCRSSPLLAAIDAARVDATAPTDRPPSRMRSAPHNR